MVAPRSWTEVHPSGQGRENQPVSLPAGLSGSLGVKESECPAVFFVSSLTQNYLSLRLPRAFPCHGLLRSRGGIRVLLQNPWFCFFLPPGLSVPSIFSATEKSVCPSTEGKSSPSGLHAERFAELLGGTQLSFWSRRVFTAARGPGLLGVSSLSFRPTTSYTHTQHHREESWCSVPVGDFPVWT